MQEIKLSLIRPSLIKGWWRVRLLQDIPSTPHKNNDDYVCDVSKQPNNECIPNRIGFAQCVLRGKLTDLILNRFEDKEKNELQNLDKTANQSEPIVTKPEDLTSKEKLAQKKRSSTIDLETLGKNVELRLKVILLNDRLNLFSELVKPHQDLGLMYAQQEIISISDIYSQIAELISIYVKILGQSKLKNVIIESTTNTIKVKRLKEILKEINPQLPSINLSLKEALAPPFSVEEYFLINIGDYSIIEAVLHKTMQVNKVIDLIYRNPFHLLCQSLLQTLKKRLDQDKLLMTQIINVLNDYYDDEHKQLNKLNYITSTLSESLMQIKDEQQSLSPRLQVQLASIQIEQEISRGESLTLINQQQELQQLISTLPRKDLDEGVELELKLAVGFINHYQAEQALSLIQTRIKQVDLLPLKAETKAKLYSLQGLLQAICKTADKTLSDHSFEHSILLWQQADLTEKERRRELQQTWSYRQISFLETNSQVFGLDSKLFKLNKTSTRKQNEAISDRIHLNKISSNWSELLELWSNSPQSTDEQYLHCLYLRCAVAAISEGSLGYLYLNGLNIDLAKSWLNEIPNQHPWAAITWYRGALLWAVNDSSYMPIARLLLERATTMTKAKDSVAGSLGEFMAVIYQICTFILLKEELTAEEKQAYIHDIKTTLSGLNSVEGFNEPSETLSKEFDAYLAENRADLTTSQQVTLFLKYLKGYFR